MQPGTIVIYKPDPLMHGRMVILEITASGLHPRRIRFPIWVEDALRLVERLQRSGLRIRTLRLTDQQWREYEAFLCSPPRTLWGYPVEKRTA